MTRYALLLLLIAFVSCSKTEQRNTGIIGKWQRTEVYSSPGFPVDWQRADDYPKVRVEFTADGKVISNSSPYIEFASYRTFAQDSVQFTSTTGEKRTYNYAVENGKLTIWFLCIEGCGDKFVRGWTAF